MPLIGIMTDHPYPLPRSFAQASRIGVRLQSQFVYFLPGAVDWKSERLFAIKWDGNEWKRDWTALPDLVVNQIRYRHIETSHLCQNDLSQFKKQKIPVWSPSLFNKFQLGLSLLAAPHDVIPSPAGLSANADQEEIREFIAAKQAVISKPVFSNAGRGFVWISYKNGCYHRKGLSLGGRPTQQEHLVWEELASIQSEMYGNHEWFWQEELKRSTHSTRPAEWHALLGRDREAGWQITGVYPLRRSGAPITRQGSGLTTWIPPIKDSSLLATAKHLEREFGPFPELTLDLLITKQDTPVLLDASPRVQRHLYPEKVRQSTTARWVQFIAREADKHVADGQNNE
ncbi:MAG: hypothetical protein JWN30_1319 [Bacilli bacterium]|nr:hypothetical protein [Bacilli bacterium]